VCLYINKKEKYGKNYGLSVSYNIMQLRETNICNSASLAMRHESNISLSAARNQPLSGHTPGSSWKKMFKVTPPAHKVLATVL
jgi:hypothetical protein